MTSTLGLHHIDFNTYSLGTDLVGMDLATPFSPSLKKGTQSLAYAVMTATLSEGDTKNWGPRIIALSASPSHAPPKSGKLATSAPVDKSREMVITEKSEAVIREVNRVGNASGCTR